MPYKIQVFNTIAATGLQHFPVNDYIVAPDILEPDAILLRSASLHGMNLPKSVKVIGRAGVGTNNIPLPIVNQLGIPVLNTPGANANAVKELVLAGLLMACRKLPAALNFMTQLTQPRESLEHVKAKFSGSELLGKTLGVIGLGNVGVKVANASVALGMFVIGYDPTICVQRAWELCPGVTQATSLERVLTQSDFISLHIPLTTDTQGIINAACFEQFKPGVVLLNFSRGELVDTEALWAALEKSLGAYVCDFPAACPLNHPKVICLPYLGASTREAEELCAVMIVKQVRDYLEKGTITHAVNLPPVAMACAGHYRLSIVNLNIPNIVAQITAHLGQAHRNILDLINKSQDELAYTLIDVDGPIGPVLSQQITCIEGVLQLREIPMRA